MVKTTDFEFLLITSADGTKLDAFNLEDLVQDVPYLRAQDMHEIKDKEKQERIQRSPKVTEFFKDMLDEEDEVEDSIEQD